MGQGILDWIGPDGLGTVGRAVGEFSGDDEGVLGVGSCDARAGKRTFVKVAGLGKLIGGELNGVQFRAHGGDRLAVVRLHADVDIVSGDGACVVDGKFHVACPRTADRSGTGGIGGRGPPEYTAAIRSDTAERVSPISEACVWFLASVVAGAQRTARSLSYWGRD